MANSPTPSNRPLTVAVIGLGQMGTSHALAYHHSPHFHILSLTNRSPIPNLPPSLSSYPFHQSSTLDEALPQHPDLVSINTHVDSHASLALAALERGAHVFVEKPLGTGVAESARVIAVARRTKRKLVVGYILRHHPSWRRFIHEAREMGPPFVLRMNLNQRSRGEAWEGHKKLLKTSSPVVDCGVHYVDVMLQITDSRPRQVRGMGVRLSDEIDAEQVNYGHLQVLFEDGSVGWYEAGWGPMISETAYFVKDVMGPRGSVSIVGEEDRSSADVGGHTRTARLRIHRVDGGEDQVLSMEGEPDHQALCDLEQDFLRRAIVEDLDLEKHWADAIRSQAVVAAADLSMREDRAVDL